LVTIDAEKCLIEKLPKTKSVSIPFKLKLQLKRVRNKDLT